MFQNWGFLLGEIWILILLAALLGLLAGWLIWGGNQDAKTSQDHDKNDAQKEETSSVDKTVEEVKKSEPEQKAVTGEKVKPDLLTAARDGQGDDLKKIKGVGPGLEKACNAIGIYHYDQIASWNADEVAWVDDNLLKFKGRVSRDGWVDQAKKLAAGEETEFSKKVSKGNVY